MRFIPKAQQEEKPEVVVTTQNHHTFTTTIYPKQTQKYTDRDYEDDSDSE